MKHVTTALIAIVACAVGSNMALADVGPKPTIDIVLPQKLVKRVAAGKLLQCEKADCSDAAPMLDMGPQFFRCNAPAVDKTGKESFIETRVKKGHCGGMAYGFAHYLQLQLTLTDGSVLTSAAFSEKTFSSQFKAAFKDGKLTVK